MNSPVSNPLATSTNTISLSNAGHSKVAADTTRPSASPTLENSLLNNNNLKLDNANGNAGSKTARYVKAFFLNLGYLGRFSIVYPNC